MAIDRAEALRKAEKLLRQGRLDGAIAEYERVLQAFPDDIATAAALGDLHGRAGQKAQAVGQFTRVGDHWLRQGMPARAANAYKRVLKFDPHHESALLQLVEACTQQGLIAAAKTHLRSAIDRRRGRGDQSGADGLAIRLSELDPSDFGARLEASHIRVGTGKATEADLLELARELDAREDEARELLGRYLSIHPEGVEAVAALGEALPSATGRYVIVDLLVTHASDKRDYGKAARRLEGFLERMPRHEPALLRLVEVCVDGDLDATLTTAQAELAEAYLATEDAAKARVIAEDLLFRDPRSVAHRDRLRRVLETLGEADPDAVIADCLGFVQDEDDEESDPAESAPEAEAEIYVEASDEPVAAALDGDAGDVGEEAVEFEAMDFGPWSDPEVDLTSAVDELRASSPELEEAVVPVTREAAPEPPEAVAGATVTLENVFAGMRGRAGFDAGPLPVGDHAARSFRVGQTYTASNMVKEAAAAFEKAARDPRYRFRSAQALARLFRKQQMLEHALEWLDIAAESSAPSIDEHRTALYEWADALEAGGETTRALGVLLDLVAEQGDYKDVRARIERLSRVQA